MLGFFECIALEEVLLWSFKLLFFTFWLDIVERSVCDPYLDLNQKNLVVWMSIKLKSDSMYVRLFECIVLEVGLGLYIG